MTDGWYFEAIGTPRPQGSKRHVGGGRLIESSPHVSTWREDVKYAALQIRSKGAPCLNGPLAVRMIFTLARPKTAHRLRHWPDRIPDLSKLARATEDAITAAGLWADDARVVLYDPLAKVWSDHPDALPVPGVRVAATVIHDDDTYLQLPQLWNTRT